MTNKEQIQEWVDHGYISPRIGTVILKHAKSDDSPLEEIAEKHGLWKLGHNPRIDRELDDAIFKAIVDDECTSAVVGSVMKSMRGHANPSVVRDRLRWLVDRERKVRVYVHVQDGGKRKDTHVFDMDLDKIRGSGPVDLQLDLQGM